MTTGSSTAALRAALAAAERRAEEAEKSRDVAVAQVAGRPTWDDLQFATDQVNAAELKAEGEREFRRRAESSLASERAARESWEREFNVANAERIRLHNEAENLSERLHQFEAAGFPNVATVLDRVEAERAARERAERERESQRSDAVKFHGMLLAAESSLSRAVEALREIAGEGLPIGSLPVCHRCKALRDAARAVLAEVGK